MNAALIVHLAGPSLTVQDLGRSGYMAFGLSAGGAADRKAIIEGAVLLGQDADCAALEMSGFGGVFEATCDMRIALTGAPMQAHLDDQSISWNASHTLTAGQRLAISAPSSGMFGYLHVEGGFAVDLFLGSRATHLTAGIGALVQAGDHLPVQGVVALSKPSQKLPDDNRFLGGLVRVLPSVQTTQFSKAMIDRFTATTFTRSARGNRQGIALDFEGDPFALDGQLTILSEPMLTGDIQMTGEGRPFVLLPECQTIGGYPRIATVMPDDLPIVAQAQPGTAIRFEFVDLAEACARHVPQAQQYADLKKKLRPLLRDPRDIADLLGYQLISGAITGWD